MKCNFCSVEEIKNHVHFRTGWVSGCHRSCTRRGRVWRTTVRACKPIPRYIFNIAEAWRRSFSSRRLLEAVWRTFLTMVRKNEVRFRWPCWATNTGTTTMSHMYSINIFPTHVIVTNRTRGTLWQHATSHEGVDCPSCMCQGRGSIRRRLSLDWGCSCYIYAMIDLLIVRSWLNQNQSRINDLHTAYLHHCASVPSCFVLTFLSLSINSCYFPFPLPKAFRRADLTIHG